MRLLSKLEQLVKEEKEGARGYKLALEDGPVPKEWSHLPANKEEGFRGIMSSLIARQGWPEYVSQIQHGSIWFDCGPVQKMSCNPNGYAHTSGNISWLDVIETLVQARINEK